MAGVRIPLLAVDGGGTKCMAVFTETDGGIVGTGRAGSCNYQGIGAEAASRELAKAIRAAMSDASRNRAGVSLHETWEVDCAVFGMAGLDTEHDREVIVRMVEGVLRRLDIRVRHLIVENDGFAALLGATDGQPGILVIAGTGSIAYGVNSQGVHARAGGWGHRIGDEGSGYWIGKRAITAVLKAADGRGEPTSLTGLLLPYLELRQVEELFNWTYGPAYSVENVAGLSPLVSQAAAEGDAVAEKILRDAGEELFLAARTVMDRLGMAGTPFKMILQGGVLQNDERVRAILVERVLRYAPQVRIDKAKNEPICGVIAKGVAVLKGGGIP